MSSSAIESESLTAISVNVSDDLLTVELNDGRLISAPVSWYPRLAHGTGDECNQWRLNGAGSGIHWPALDEDISVANLLRGQASGESQESFKKWLETRSALEKS